MKLDFKIPQHKINKQITNKQNNNNKPIHFTWKLFGRKRKNS